SHWTGPQRVTADYPTAISCASPDMCVVVNGTTFAQFDGSSWSAPMQVLSGSLFQSISCPSPSFCMAGDTAGRVLTFDGHAWSKPSIVDDGYELTVACPSPDFCGAIDDRSSVLTYAGTEWTEPQRIPTEELTA